MHNHVWCHVCMDTLYRNLLTLKLLCSQHTSHTSLLPHFSHKQDSLTCSCNLKIKQPSLICLPWQQEFQKVLLNLQNKIPPKSMTVSVKWDSLFHFRCGTLMGAEVTQKCISGKWSVYQFELYKDMLCYDHLSLTFCFLKSFTQVKKN